MKPKNTNNPAFKKGRGAQTNPPNAFLIQQYSSEESYLNYCYAEEESATSNTTRYITVHPKSIINKIDSPDIPFQWSINPYQGCEHGCSYCYARTTHEYWGYSAGTDFEQTILVKEKAAFLLRETFAKKSWQPELIVLSGNTDCYQPAEQTFKITRQLLEVFLECRNPVGIITKNSLILRDLDLLQELHRLQLIGITLSITTLDDTLRRAMEPRTSSVKNRLKALEVLSKIGIPVNVNMAPIIPGLNSHEIFDLVQRVADLGASSVSYIMARLNGPIAPIFENWLQNSYPNRSEKVLNLIRETHGGALTDSRFKVRMKGEGQYAAQIAESFRVAKLKSGLGDTTKSIKLNTTLFERPGKGGQLGLF
jgi:DNA repair photolyase